MRGAALGGLDPLSKKWDRGDLLDLFPADSQGIASFEQIWLAALIRF